jgi:hypothetical protein
MTDPGNWPDPARPGYPLNPEQCEFHNLIRKVNRTVERLYWQSELILWFFPNENNYGAFEIATVFDYLGPCEPPASKPDQSVLSELIQEMRQTASLATDSKEVANAWLEAMGLVQRALGISHVPAAGKMVDLSGLEALADNFERRSKLGCTNDYGVGRGDAYARCHALLRAEIAKIRGGE